MKSFVAFAFFAFSFVSAQSTTEQTPTRIRVYTPSGLQSTEKQQIVKEDYNWIIKTDLLACIAGEFPLIGEYRIAKRLSIEASAGITYGLYPNGGISELGGDDSGYDAKPDTGTAFRGSIKYYPSADYDALEGWSFGIQVFTRENNRDYKPGDRDGEETLRGKKDTRIKTGMSLTIAKQVFEESNIAFETYLGLGVASVKRDHYVSAPNPYDTGNSYFPVAVSETDIKPNFQFGLRIGFSKSRTKGN